MSTVILPELLGRYFTNTETLSVKNNMEVSLVPLCMFGNSTQTNIKEVEM